MATPNWLQYSNQGATRNQPLSPQLLDAFGKFLPELGVTMQVFSGGQEAEGPNRVGSHRHDHGNSGDVFFSKDGRRLDWSNPQDLPIFEQIVSKGKGAGITGFGAGPGYMQPGSMHVGFGHPGVWGAGGSGKNAPEWLVKAFNGAPAGQSVHSQVAANQTAPISVASGAPAPALPAPINVGDSPVAPAQTQTAPSAPPPGILAGLMGGGQQASQGGDMSGILQMLMAEQEQPQPMQLQPMRPAAQPGQPGLAEYIQSFLQSRTA